ncbi:hypothetical protein VTI74DRAFT_2706 [Chaetomium olivicolor]
MAAWKSRPLASSLLLRVVADTDMSVLWFNTLGRISWARSLTSEKRRLQITRQWRLVHSRLCPGPSKAILYAPGSQMLAFFMLFVLRATTGRRGPFRGLAASGPARRGTTLAGPDLSGTSMVSLAELSGKAGRCGGKAIHFLRICPFQLCAKFR